MPTSAMRFNCRLEFIVMRLTINKGMVDIDGDEIAYGNIKGMYQTGSGHGLQLSERLEHKRGEIIDLCSDIADRIYELQAITDA